MNIKRKIEIKTNIVNSSIPTRGFFSVSKNKNHYLSELVPIGRMPVCVWRYSLHPHPQAVVLVLFSRTLHLEK